jgi:hypothetical protein
MLKDKLKLWLLAPAIAISISVIKPAFSGVMVVYDPSVYGQVVQNLKTAVQIYNQLRQVEQTLKDYTKNPSLFISNIMSYLNSEINRYNSIQNGMARNSWNEYGRLDSGSVVNVVRSIDSPVIVSIDKNGNPILTTASGKQVGATELQYYVDGILTTPDSKELVDIERKFGSDPEVKRSVMSIRAKKSEFRSILEDTYMSQMRIKTYEKKIDEIVSKMSAGGVDAGEMEKLKAQLIALNSKINAEIARQVANQNKIQAIVASNNISYEEVQRANLLRAYEAVKGNKR